MKSTTKIFIGGLVIGSTVGAVIGALTVASIFLSWLV